MTSATLAALDREWNSLAGSPPARAALIRWGRVEPHLAGLDSLDRVLALRRDPAVAPRVLGVLAAFAPRDPIASRTLLQALIPGLVRLARTAGHDDRGALDELVSLAYERIRTYPDSRHGSVAANVLLDVRKAYRRHRIIDRPTAPDARQRRTTPSAEEQVLARTVVDELVAARRRGIIDDRSLRLIVRTRMEDEPIEDLAREQRVKVNCLVARRSRAERRLRTCLDPVA